MGPPGRLTKLNITGSLYDETHCVPSAINTWNNATKVALRLNMKTESSLVVFQKDNFLCDTELSLGHDDRHVHSSY